MTWPRTMTGLEATGTAGTAASVPADRDARRLRTESVLGDRFMVVIRRAVYTSSSDWSTLASAVGYCPTLRPGLNLVRKEGTFGVFQNHSAVPVMSRDAGGQDCKAVR
jgi:hypothetical protein